MTEFNVLNQIAQWMEFMDRKEQVASRGRVVSPISWKMDRKALVSTLPEHCIPHLKALSPGLRIAQ